MYTISFNGAVCWASTNASCSRRTISCCAKMRRASSSVCWRSVSYFGRLKCLGVDGTRIIAMDVSLVASLQVARRGAHFGMPAPLLIQFEKEIDREMAKENNLDADDQDDDEEEDGDQLVEYGPAAQIVTNDLRSLDEMVSWRASLPLFTIHCTNCGISLRNVRPHSVEHFRSLEVFVPFGQQVRQGTVQHDLSATCLRPLIVC